MPTYELTLRGQRDRLQLTQLVESGVQGSNIELGLEGKVVKLGGGPQLFKFAKRTQRSEEMIGLSDHSLSRRFGQRGILLQRLVIAFHVPSEVSELRTCYITLSYYTSVPLSPLSPRRPASSHSALRTAPQTAGVCQQGRWPVSSAAGDGTSAALPQRLDKTGPRPPHSQSPASDNSVA